MVITTKRGAHHTKYHPHPSPKSSPTSVWNRTSSRPTRHDLRKERGRSSKQKQNGDITAIENSTAIFSQIWSAQNCLLVLNVGNGGVARGCWDDDITSDYGSFMLIPENSLRSAPVRLGWKWNHIKPSMESCGSTDSSETLLRSQAPISNCLQFTAAWNSQSYVIIN